MRPRRGKRQFRSDYRFVGLDKTFVFLIDLDREGCCSVTNDAELVVPEVLAKYGPRRIIYRDSMGRWDELKHDGKAFTGYAPWLGTPPVPWTGTPGETSA